MSTKVTIKNRLRTGTSPGYHLYDDVLDSLGESDDGQQAPIYLRLDGVQVELATLADGGASVTITLPRETAVDLGLLSLAGRAQGSNPT